TNLFSMLGFIFFTALRDKRYKLIHHSADELSIQLSNITVQDEGVYKCFCYGSPFKSKNKTVEVLAAPSHPIPEVSQDTERSITLSCYTQGCKPQPRITWLLDNGIELPGDTKHKLEADGKKWTTTSSLTVLAHRPNSTASCIVHHPALREEKLKLSFHFEDLIRTGTAGSPIKSYPRSEQQIIPSVAPEDPTHGNLLTQHTSASFTEEDLKSEGIKKEKNLLLPILVATLIFALLIIVLLFMRKVKKAHGVWKRENDVSEQTLESYKSKCNEDSPGHEKNGH
ncbi:CRTAM protein, partial [Tricholaema leucomelas]|nr:CRTAM protein [Tricholaema leucomelas]